VLNTSGILSGNSIEARYRGRVQGIRQSVIGIGRGLGSIFGGILFSWSLASDKRSGIFGEFPFDFYFT